MKKRNRVIAADPHWIVLEGLKQHFSHKREVELIGVAQDADTLLNLLKEQKADVLLMEVELLTSHRSIHTTFTAIDVIKQAKRIDEDILVIIYTGYQNGALMDILLAVGADGILLKTEGPVDIAGSVETVVEWSRVDAKLAPSPAIWMRPYAKQLSDAEARVLTYLAVKPGDSIEEIAENLGLAVGTIKFHLAKIYEKLGTTKRAEAVLTAFRLGILPPSLILNIPDGWEPKKQ